MATKRPRKGQGDAQAGAVSNDELKSSPNVRTALIQGVTFGIKPVQYSAIDGMAMFEGDIVLGTDEEVQKRTDELRSVASGMVELSIGIRGSQFRWANCRIPYTIDPALPDQARVSGAIAHWESHTPFRFVLRTAANAASFADYVTFRPSSGCSSSVGRQGGQQFVNLGPGCTMGNAIHEIGHVVGLWHEQSRHDRDSFVTIHWDKIQAGLTHNFDQHIADGDDIGAYDYGSIMHYPRNAFSVDGSDTITPIAAGATIGQRTALSPGDIAAASSFCQPVATLKEAPRDITRKELAKDIRLDTRKEMVLDTVKEGARDPLNPIGPIVNPGRLGPLPFAVATPHQAPAPAQADGGEPANEAVQLDEQLQGIADALLQAEVSRRALQEQYDETAALLKKAIAAQEPKDG